MWVNEMLTIWLYGTIFSIVVIVISLFTLYKRED